MFTSAGSICGGAFVVDIVAVFGDEVDTGTACIVNLDGESVFVDAISGFERDDCTLLLKSGPRGSLFFVCLLEGDFAGA